MYVPGRACKRGIGDCVGTWGSECVVARVCHCVHVTLSHQCTSLSASGLPSVQNFVGVKRVPVMCAILIVRFSFARRCRGV